MPTKKPPQPPTQEAHLSARIPEALKRRFKSAAAANGKKLEEATEQAVREWLDRYEK